MKAIALLPVLFFAWIVGLNLNAQIDVKQKIKDKAIERADQHVDEGIDKGLDAVEEGVEDAVKNEEGEEQDNNAEVKVDSETEPVDNTNAEADATQKQDNITQSLESYTKYDFIPGDQIILYEDFSQDAVGDFPALWTTNGSGEVKTLNLYPGHWLHMLASNMTYQLQNPIDLPENFIFEFDVVPTRQPENSDASFSFTLFNADNDNLNEDYYPGEGGFNVVCSEQSWAVEGYDEGGANTSNGSTVIACIENEKLSHVILWVQKRRVRIYHKGQKAVDLPTVLYPGQKVNHLRFTLWNCLGFPYVTNLRFTSAAPDMRSKLLTEGKIVSYGIYFDVNSDKVKPESYGALNEIANVLKENPSVKINIVGHTDSNGDDAKNLDLSKRRAAAVKNEFTESFGIDATRIETDGKGESQPVEPNTTPAGKAKNRRVEFIKL